MIELPGLWATVETPGAEELVAVDSITADCLHSANVVWRTAAQYVMMTGLDAPYGRAEIDPPAIRVSVMARGWGGVAEATVDGAANVTWAVNGRPVRWPDYQDMPSWWGLPGDVERFLRGGVREVG